MYDCRTGRVPARAGRGCGGHAEHGAVPAAGAARVARARERRARGVAGEARLLGQRLQRAARRQAPPRLRAVARLQRGRRPAHRHQRRRRLAQDLGVRLQNTTLPYELVKLVKRYRIYLALRPFR